MTSFYSYNRSLPCGALLLAALWLVGCAGSQRATQPFFASERGVTNNALALRLQAATADWHGTPHVLGGTTKRGVDCSGFVQAVYRDHLGVSLPRTTAGQVRAGTSVKPNTLQAGDLVFFRLPRKTRHVGIYLNDGSFAHASSSQGVTVSNLADPYWQRHYWTSRRVVTPLPAHEPVTERTRPQPAGNTGRRTAW